MYLVTVLIIRAMRMKKDGKSLSDLIADLKEPAESREIRLNITDPDFRARGQAVIDLIRTHAEGTEGWHIAPDNREGIRVSFDIGGQADSGWFLLRLSVHDPVLPLNCESDVAGGVKDILTRLYRLLEGQKGIELGALEQELAAGSNA